MTVIGFHNSHEQVHPAELLLLGGASTPTEGTGTAAPA